MTCQDLLTVPYLPWPYLPLGMRGDKQHADDHGKPVGLMTKGAFEEVAKIALPRGVRIEYPGAFYHVMARGSRRERIYHDEVDRRFFLQALGGWGEVAGKWAL